jgi:hypothetical protein
MQWLLIPAATLALFLFWDFTQRTATLARLSELEQQKQQQLVRAQATQVALADQKIDAQGDERVKKIARGWGWVEPGDTLVRTPATPTAIPIAPARPAPPESKSWVDQLLEFLGWR